MKLLLLRLLDFAASAVEVATGATLCCALSLAVPAVCLLGVIGPRDRPPPAADRLVAGSLFAVTVVLGGYCVFLALAPLLGRQRWGPEVALRQPRWPVPLRPILSSYWIGHFLLGAILAVGAERVGLESARGKSARESIGPLTLLAAGVFALTYSANFYLLLALSAVTRSPVVVHKVWRWRVLIDVLLSGAAVIAGRFVP